MLAGNLEIFPDAEESRGVRYGPKKHSLAEAARQRVDWREGRPVGVAADDIGDALAVSQFPRCCTGGLTSREMAPARFFDGSGY